MAGTVFRRRNLTSKVDPRAERVSCTEISHRILDLSGNHGNYYSQLVISRPSATVQRSIYVTNIYVCLCGSVPWSFTQSESENSKHQLVDGGKY